MHGLLKLGAILVIVGALTWSVVWSAEVDRLEWVWLSPDHRIQTGFVLEIHGPPGKPERGRLVREEWSGGKAHKETFELEAPVLRHLLLLAGGKSLRALEWTPDRSCDRSSHWEVVLPNSPRKIVPVCGNSAGAARIQKLSQALQTLASSESSTSP